MIPTIGRIVNYALSEQDANTINAQRVTGYPVGANPVYAGDVFPMMIVRVWGANPDSAVQGQVFIDGNFTFWATSVTAGDGPRHYTWPEVNA